MSSDNQEIPCILWNTEVYYRIHNGLPPVPILNQIIPVYASLSHFLKIQMAWHALVEMDPICWAVDPNIPVRTVMF
jgi:hypothetical protein